MNIVPIVMYHGLSASHGLIRDEGDQLCVEFQEPEDPVVVRTTCPSCAMPVEVRRSQVNDSAVGPVKSRIQQVRIPRTEVVSVALQRSFFGLVSKLVIQLAHLEPVKDLPGVKQGRLVLNVESKDREAAKVFVAGLNGLKGE